MKKSVLFLCTGNSCRSQMAEGWARHLWGDRYDCYSAGTEKHGMNHYAIEVMKEAGVDITKHYSKTTQELPPIRFDLVVTVCDAAKEKCPFFPGVKVVHRGFPDPPKLAQGLDDKEAILKIYRKVCEEIKIAIQGLPEMLDKQ